MWQTGSNVTMWQTGSNVTMWQTGSNVTMWQTGSNVTMWQTGSNVTMWQTGSTSQCGRPETVIFLQSQTVEQVILLPVCKICTVKIFVNRGKIKFLNGRNCSLSSGGSRISPGGGGVPTYDFAKFSQKQHEIERIWVPGGGGGGAPLLRLVLFPDITRNWKSLLVTYYSGDLWRDLVYNLL